MTGDRPVLAGLLLYLLIAAAPTLIVWLALRLIPGAFSRVLDRRRRRRMPPGPSLESTVANLRRLRREVMGPPPSSAVRRQALLDAYDATLVEVCGVVGVDAQLAEATVGDRAFARLLTEAALEDAGIALDPPAGGVAAA